MSGDKNDRGADWQSTGKAPFDERPGPMTPPHTQQERREQPGRGEKAVDTTDVGQPASAPGTHGGATPFGGVQRDTKRQG